MSGILKENKYIVMYFYKYNSVSILECQDVFYDIIYHLINSFAALKCRFLMLIIFFIEISEKSNHL
jgi:hypothetical protein